jgi:plastocyanin
MRTSLSPARQHSFVGCLRRRYLLTVAAGALLIPAAAAQAATKDVYAGTPPKGVLKGVPPIALDNAFYPKKVTINKGDRIAFRIAGFHNVLSVPKGTEAPALFVPNPDAPVTGAKDPAGADYWFNGQPSIAPNPQVVAPVGPKVVDGSQLVGSGLPQGPPKPYKLRFPKTGTYTFLCSVHPGMKMTVTVKGARADVPSRKQDARRVQRQARKAAELAKRLVDGEGTPGGRVVRAGNDRGTLATLAFFPERTTVKVGQTVRFELSRGTTEIHNVAFGPAEFVSELAQTFLGPTGIDPVTAYSSEPPGTPLSHHGANHGNGYLNTGILDVEPGSPMPSSATVTFTKPGRYTYYCVVHGAEMKGVIRVTS